MSRTLTVLLIGIAIGILIAPDKGTSTRSKLGDFFSDVSDNAQEGAEDFVGNVKRTAKDVSSRVKDTVKNAKSNLE